MSIPDHPVPDAVTGVVVGDDGSGRALEAIEYAAEEAARRGTSLTVVRTWNIKNAVRPADVGPGVIPSTQEFQDATEAHTRARAESVAARFDVPVHAMALHGSPTKALLQLSRTADVVVVGDRGVTGLAGRIIGSVADTVVREAECPVVVVRRRQDG